MDDKITIIEGPPPTFEEIGEGWAIGLGEGPALYDLALTRLRTFNSSALVERCYRTWKEHATMHLHYRNDMGLEERASIVAARAMETEEGDLLLLWIRRDPGAEEITIDLDDDYGEEGFNDNDFPV
jgi:hypothetical protein